MAILTRVDVKADKLVEFEAFIKGDWLSALKKGGGKSYSVNQVVYGGSTTEYMTLVGIDSFADLDKGHPVTKALGDDGVVKLMAKSGTFTKHIDRTIIRLDPDLSFEVKGCGTVSRISARVLEVLREPGAGVSGTLAPASAGRSR